MFKLARNFKMTLLHQNIALFTVFATADTFLGLKSLMLYNFLNARVIFYCKFSIFKQLLCYFVA